MRKELLSEPDAQHQAENSGMEELVEETRMLMLIKKAEHLGLPTEVIKNEDGSLNVVKIFSSDGSYILYADMNWMRSVPTKTKKIIN